MILGVRGRIPNYIFDPGKDAYCRFMHNQNSDENKECNNKGINPAEESVRDIGPSWQSGIPTKRGWGGEYAPLLLPSRYAKVKRDQTSLYFLMSTWNPYQVVLMRTQLRVSP